MTFLLQMQKCCKTTGKNTNFGFDDATSLPEISKNMRNNKLFWARVDSHMILDTFQACRKHHKNQWKINISIVRRIEMHQRPGNHQNTTVISYILATLDFLIIHVCRVASRRARRHPICACRMRGRFCCGLSSWRFCVALGVICFDIYIQFAAWFSVMSLLGFVCLLV